MQLRPFFPDGTVGNCCFVTGSSTIPEGEQVLDLDRDVEDMPGWGRLVILPEAVRQMVECLGWKLDTGDAPTVKQLKATIEQMTAEREQLRTALRAVVLTAQDAGIDIEVLLSGEPVSA